MQGELVVAGVFVRVYNQQPGFAMGHEEATSFCKGLVTWINTHSKQSGFCTVPSPTGEYSHLSLVYTPRFAYLDKHY